MRTLLLLITLVAATFLEAQERSAPLVTLQDDDGQVLNDSVVIVHGSAMDAALSYEVYAYLTGPVAATVSHHRYELGVVPGAEHLFCWGLDCLAPTASGWLPLYTGTPVPMQPQQMDVLGLTYLPNGTSGMCGFRFVWSDQNDPTDSTWVDVLFDTQAIASVEELAAGASINAFPDPVAEGDVTFTFDAAFGHGAAELVLFNAWGQRSLVRSLAGTDGRTTVPASTLAPGVWFAGLVRNGRVLATRRFVVAH